MLILLTPIQLFLFQRINITSFLANLWAVPIILFVTIPVIMVSHICLYWHAVQSLLFDIIDKSISLALWLLTYLECYWFATGNVPIMITTLSWFIILC